MTELQGYTQAFVDVMNSKLAQDIMDAYDKGAKDKEDAIIKLLEAICGQQPDCNCEIVISHAIALIEGENK